MNTSNKPFEIFQEKDSKKSTEEGSTSIPTVSEKVEEEDLKKRKKKSSKKGSTSGKKETIRLACIGLNTFIKKWSDQFVPIFVSHYLLQLSKIS